MKETFTIVALNENELSTLNNRQVPHILQIIIYKNVGEKQPKDNFQFLICRAKKQFI